jgi:hypothetical protein
MESAGFYLEIAIVVVAALYFCTPKIPKGAPNGPRRLPIIGNLLALGSDPPPALLKIAKQYDIVYNLIFSPRLFGRRFFMLV